jgi:polyhydroxyalkanoate synthesis regulator phasin
VPTTKERLDEFESRLAVVETAGAPANTTLRRVRGWIARYKVSSIMLGVAIVGLIIATLQLWYPAHSEHVNDDFKLRVDSRIDTRLIDLRKDLSDVKGGVTEMKATLDTLKPFIQDLVQSQMNKAAHMPASELQQNLSEIRNVVEVARRQKVPIEMKTVQTIEQKLRSLPSRTDQFWQVSADLISYRSLVYGLDYSSTWTAPMPKCADIEPHPSTLGEAVGPGEQTVKVNPAYYENCRVQLDSAEENEKISSYAKRYVGLTFRHCLVIYRGGPVNIRLGLGALTFENCLLDLSIYRTPPVSGQKVTEFLLAKNIERFKLTELVFR